MNNFYKDLEKHNNGKICFDMQDIVRTSQIYIYKDLFVIPFPLFR